MDNYSGAGSGQEVLQETRGAEEVAGTNTHKFLWLTFFGIIFVVIVVSLFLVFTPPGSTEKGVSDKQLMEGATVASGENESIKFKFGDADHNINIDFIGLDSVGITIQSDPIKFNLSINEVKEVDLNSDGIYDIRVKLVKIENGKATIAVKKIEIVVCNGIWNCSSWGDCSGGKQIRICKDLNDCGKIENKPFTEKSCVEIVFIENDSAFDENNSVNDTGLGNLTNNTITGNLTNNTTETNNQTTFSSNNTNTSNSTNSTSTINTTNDTLVRNSSINTTAAISASKT
jgi:hypothetical protein